MTDEPITTAEQMREEAAEIADCMPFDWSGNDLAAAIRAIPIAPPAPDPRVAALVEAGDKLSLAAQTSCGTAGRDDNLVAAIEAWTAARAALGETGDG